MKAFPERTFDVGIAEANMIGVAAGLAACGKIPFANSFTPFATRRCLDQVTISCAYTKLPVKIGGTCLLYTSAPLRRPTALRGSPRKIFNIY